MYWNKCTSLACDDTHFRMTIRDHAYDLPWQLSCAQVHKRIRKQQFSTMRTVGEWQQPHKDPARPTLYNSRNINSFLGGYSLYNNTIFTRACMDHMVTTVKDVLHILFSSDLDHSWILDFGSHKRSLDAVTELCGFFAGLRRRVVLCHEAMAVLT